MATKDSKQRPIIIRREEVVEGGGHGGAWKVAYADFVTAMMAFFLVMWLLNTTTPEQRKGLADYFTPNNALSAGHSGNGMPFGGKTPFSQGEMVSDRGVESAIPGVKDSNPDADDEDTDAAPQQPAGGSAPAAAQGTGAQQAGGTATAPGRQAAQAGAAMKVVAVTTPATGAAAEAARQAERQTFAQAAEQMRQAVRDDPDLAGLARQLVIDQTPEGLRIQILDADRQPMFASGSSALNERARALILKIAPVLMRLPNGLSIAGHTDAAPYRGTDKTNWDLSSERANATRRLLTEAGLPEGRLRSVTGNADRSLLLPADPLAAANRRIAIVVLRMGQ
jgi:chemotaxis protein MotB